MRMLVIDDQGVVVNIAEVDPEGDWHPGDGLTAVPAPDGPVPIGAVVDGDTVTPPDEEEVPLSLEERVAKLETTVNALQEQLDGGAP